MNRTVVTPGYLPQSHVQGSHPPQSRSDAPWPPEAPGVSTRALDTLRFCTFRLRSVLIPQIRRATDVLLGSAGLILMLPITAIVGALIKLDDGGHIMFCQMRVGKDGRTFRCWKFRSMSMDAELRRQELVKDQDSVGVVRFKMSADPRTTRVGRFIRRLSLDELPQLWNVVRGDMSLVGPRPPIPEEVCKYDPHTWGRLDVRPGLTCIWQISGRSIIPFHQQVVMDLDYIQRQSLLLDWGILLKTIPAVLTARGAC